MVARSLQRVARLEVTAETLYEAIATASRLSALDTGEKRRVMR
jgi:hypothetical protein